MYSRLLKSLKAYVIRHSNDATQNIWILSLDFQILITFCILDDQERFTIRMKSTFAIGAILATAAAAFGVHYLYKTKYKKTGDAE
jgi:hypothetical protein